MSDYDMIRREAEELIAFLRGAAPLHGCWFGERHHDRPAFWWRNELGRLERAIPAADARAEAAALRAKVARLEGALRDMPKAVLRTTVCQGPQWPDDRPGVWLAALEACAKSVQAAVDAALTDGGSNE